MSSFGLSTRVSRNPGQLNPGSTRPESTRPALYEVLMCFAQVIAGALDLITVLSLTCLNYRANMRYLRGIPLSTVYSVPFNHALI